MTARSRNSDEKTASPKYMREFSEYHYSLDNGDPEGIAALGERIYAAVCRRDVLPPGFFLLDFGADCGSRELRQGMVELVRALDRHHRDVTGFRLRPRSMARFDQQNSTRPHRDGAPDDSLLVLGYEPTPVHSELRMADYSAWAAEHQISPAEFLERHNPMYQSNDALLEPYTTTLKAFQPRHYQLLVINNSCGPLDGEHQQGVLHQATIDDPSEEHLRVVNSITVSSLPESAADPVSAGEAEQFLETDHLSG